MELGSFHDSTPLHIYYFGGIHTLSQIQVWAQNNPVIALILSVHSFVYLDN